MVNDQEPRPRSSPDPLVFLRSLTIRRRSSRSIENETALNEAPISEEAPPLRFPRVRFTVGRLMTLVFAMGMAVWVTVEVAVKTPERARAVQKRASVQNLINHHDVRARGWESKIWEHLPPGSEQDRKRQDLIAWHRKRLKELSSFEMPASGLWWEEGMEVTDEELKFFRSSGGTGLPHLRYESFRR